MYVSSYNYSISDSWGGGSYQNVRREGRVVSGIIIIHRLALYMSFCFYITVQPSSYLTLFISIFLEKYDREWRVVAGIVIIIFLLSLSDSFSHSLLPFLSSFYSNNSIIFHYLYLTLSLFLSQKKKKKSSTIPSF